MKTKTPLKGGVFVYGMIEMFGKFENCLILNLNYLNNPNFPNNPNYPLPHPSTTHSVLVLGKPLPLPQKGLGRI